MQWYKVFFAILSVIGLVGAGSAPPPGVGVDNDFSLAIGKTVAIETLVIKFDKVIEDSRCPVNAVCVWAGNGKVELEILDVDGAKQIVVLNTQTGTREVALKAYKLKLVALNPPRNQGVAIAPDDYSLTLRVER